jgi:hypothetical protein
MKKTVADMVKDLDTEHMVERLLPHQDRRPKPVGKAVSALRSASGASSKRRALQKHGSVLVWLESEAVVLEEQRQNILAGGGQDPGPPVSEPPRPLPSYAPPLVDEAEE